MRAFLHCLLLLICSVIFTESRSVECSVVGEGLLRGEEGERESGAREGRIEGGNMPVT